MQKRIAVKHGIPEVSVHTGGGLVPKMTAEGNTGTAGYKPTSSMKKVEVGRTPIVGKLPSGLNR